jgi:predicted RNA-binding Zn-ribbon protein involved in translation (DUF1610 family)
MNLAELLDRTFLLYRTHFVLLVGIVAVPQLLFVAAWLFLALGSTGFGGAYPSGFIEVSLLLLLPITAFTQSATVVAVSRLHLGGRISITEAYSSVAGRIISIAFMMLALGIAVGVVCLLCWPAVFLLTRWCLAIPVAIIERKGLIASASRSAELTRGWRLRILVIYVLYGVLLYASLLLWIIPAVMFLPDTEDIDAGSSTGFIMFWAIGTFLSGSLTTPLITVALSLVYYNQKVLKEGFDLLHMMLNLDSGTSPESFEGPEQRSLAEDEVGHVAGVSIRCPECRDSIDSNELRCRGCGWVVHVCGECGQIWNPRDYRPEPARIFCSGCKGELVRPSLPQEDKQQELNQVSAVKAPFPKRQTRELLPEKIRCPRCDAGLRLLPAERESCEFACPHCGNEFVIEG